MSMLRDARQITLNDLIVACRMAAAYYATAAELASNKPLAQALAGLSGDREAVADRLAEAVLAEGDIPNAPSDENELVAASIARIKAVFTRDETAQFLHDCKAREALVVETASVMLEHELEAGMRRTVAALCKDAAGRIDHLMREFPPS